MFGYIAFIDTINITARSNDDTFAFMAGGLLDSTLAGGDRFSAFSAPSADFRAIGLNAPLSLSEVIAEYGEDFAEFALMPMQILTNQENVFDIVGMVKAMDKINEKKQEATDIILQAQNKERLKDGGVGVDNYGNYKQDRDINKSLQRGFERFAAEVRADSAYENALERVANSYMGPIGSALAGLAYDALTKEQINIGNVPESIYSELKSAVVNTTAKLAVTAFGVTSVVGMFGIGLAVSAAIDEVFEMVTGLDNHFGFGGSYAGTTETGTRLYERPQSFFEGIKGMFGFTDGVGLISDIEGYKKTGQIEGFKNAAGTYVGQISDHLVEMSDRMRERMGRISERAKADADYMGRELDKNNKDKRSLGDALREWDKNKDRNGREGGGFGSADAKGETERGTRAGLGASGGSWA
ncbi:hypothetical protein [Campylobacter gastrosuis]|uniref:Uncharacterized protein n=1 Tax=Campylobacter gastrosuis TaxID=2974576 RepID=A0ABT7HPD2_9BACT|nr:hypothetical protein [Campylobacter gastrosuis]MDL0088689.1 hypothetical protein [Campylobacter gastrosuis]